MKEEYLHCFRRGETAALWALHTLCGRFYATGWVYADWPQRFMELKDELPYKGVELCPDCLNHEDLPLHLLGDV